MTTIFAVCEFRFQDWRVQGHCRAVAEENYRALAPSQAKPLYRVVVTEFGSLHESLTKEAA